MNDTVNVKTGNNSYPIYIGNDLIENTAELLSPLIIKRKVFIISDNNVAELFLEKVETSLKNSHVMCKSIVIEAGENSKNFENVELITKWLLDNSVERSSILIALGGGVIGDLTGFIASITLRGINFIQIPTTLLSQVDSSVGGKTGINTIQGKNLIGTFFQPKAVISDTNVIIPLAKREVLSGYAEICKYGLINNYEFWCWLEKNGKKVINKNPDALKKAIKISCQSKARIVEMDEKENGSRALLNLGHTFAHALETEFNYSKDLIHGEAVSIGIILAFTLSKNLGFCSASDVKRISNHFNSLELYTPKSLKKKININNLLMHMTKDKKVKDNKITFVLARGIGESFLTQEVDNDKLRSTLEILNLT